MSPRIHLVSIRVTSGIILLLGFALIASGLLRWGTAVDSSPELGSIVIGTFVVICSTLCVSWPSRTSALSGANVVFGFWTTVSPWTYGYAQDLSRLELMIGIGLAIMALGAWAVRSTFIAQQLSEVSPRRF